VLSGLLQTYTAESADVAITSLDVTSLSPVWTKDATYLEDNLRIKVPLQYSFNIWTVYGNGASYKSAFQSATAIDQYAHSLPSPPQAARICTHDELIAFTAPCDPSTLLPFSISLVFGYPTNDGFGTIETDRPSGISPLPLYDIDLSNSPDFSTIVKQWRNLNLGVQDIYTVTLRDIPVAYKGSVMYARARALNRAGLSGFGNVTNAIVLADRAQPPVLSASSLLSGRGSGVPYVKVTVAIPADTGSFSNSLVPVEAYFIEVSQNSAFSAYGLGFTQSALQPFAPSQAYTLSAFDQTGAPSSSLTVGTTYFIRVRAETYLGISNYSNVISKILVVAPGLPSNVRISYHAPLSFNLSWLPPSNFGAGAGILYPVTYQYFASTSTTAPTASSSYTTVAGGNQATHVVISGLIKGTTYFFAVRARNDAESNSNAPDGGGSWSFISSLYAIDVPSAPDNMSVTVYSHRAIKFKWFLPKDTGAGNQNHPLVRYELDYSKVGVSNEILILSGALQENVEIGLSPRVVVRGRIRAVNEVGNSLWTEPREAIVPNSVPKLCPENNYYDQGACWSCPANFPASPGGSYGLFSCFNPCTQEYLHKQYLADIQGTLHVHGDSCSWKFSAFAYKFSEQWGCRYMANSKYLCAKQAQSKH